MQKRSELFFNIILLPIDFLAVVGAFVIAYAIRVKIDGRPVPNPLGIVLFLKLFLLILPVWILIFALLGLYNQPVNRSRLTELGKIFVAVSGGTMFLILLDFFSRQPLFPAKAIAIYGYGLSFLFVALGRQVIRAVQLSLFSHNIGIHRVLLIGSGDIAQGLVESLIKTSKTGYKILGVVDSAHNAQKRMEGLKVYPSFAEALKHIRSVDEIIQADSALAPEEVLDLVSYASTHHVAYRFIPNQFGLFATNSSVTMLGGIPVIELRKTPLQGWGRIIKRAFDLIGSIAGLILLSPLFLVIATLIKSTDPGPVFYRHKRLSREGHEVYVFKFRSMILKYCTGGAYSGMSDEEVFRAIGRPELIEEFKKEQKLANDPRISKIGAFLRKTSLDELPQLINVLRGDMSLVGPRPIVEAELEHYGDETATFLTLKPGITGLWQTSGRSDISYEERVKLDIYYVENWSLWLDIKILLRTALSVFTGRGAY
jgi:exopolysaccharide biosynthesis polyprenyl glycosylphosphotransferase